jgi:hypothetical protein
MEGGEERWGAGRLAAGGEEGSIVALATCRQVVARSAKGLRFFCRRCDIDFAGAHVRGAHAARGDLMIVSSVRAVG